MEMGVAPSLIRGHKKWVADRIRQPETGSGNQPMLLAVFTDICLLNTESRERGETISPDLIKMWFSFHSLRVSSFAEFWRFPHKLPFPLGHLSWATTLVPSENESADGNWEKMKDCFSGAQIKFLRKFKQGWHTWLDPSTHLEILTFHPSKPKIQRVITIIPSKIGDWVFRYIFWITQLNFTQFQNCLYL